MAEDSTAIKLLCMLPSFGTAKVLKQLYDAINTDLPHNLRSTVVPSPPSIPDATVLHFNFDEGHSARFMVPDTNGGSVSFEWVMIRPQPMQFLMTHIAVRAPIIPASSEHVIFMPGLNTVQEPRPGETTTETRLRYYVRVLRNIPMVQLHSGSSKDQGDVRLHAKRAYMLRFLVMAIRPVLPDRMEPRIEGPDMIWSSGQLDYVQAALSAFNLIDTPLKARIRDILERTKRPNAEPVVLVGYSRSSIDVRAALEKHIEECIEKDEPQEQIESRLRKLVTVVTIGPGTTGYPDGPAYVHIATYQDPLARLAGVTSRTSADRAGKDAMFVNTDSPFAEGSFDSHNFGAVTVQYLAILMQANGVRGFRELWDKHMDGEIVVPKNVDVLLKAMMVLTDGTQWLFSPQAAWKGLGRDWLPDPATSEKAVREALGDKYADWVISEFGTPQEPKNGPRSIEDHVEEDNAGWGCPLS